MEKLLRAVYASEKKKKCLSLIGKICVGLNVVFFALVLAILALGDEWWDSVIVAQVAAIGYLTVTLLRKLLDRPRPYEVYDFYIEKPKEKHGQSFPSRHCYSAFVITTLAWLVSPLVTLGLFVLGGLICVTRVLCGIHFVRDVLVGGLIGVAFGATGVLIATFI